MKRIELTQGLHALVDDADYDWLSQFNWFASDCGKNGIPKWYACKRTPIPKTIYRRRRKKAMPHTRMHRLIMGLEYGDKRVVHHKDDNSLNNQRDNLVIVATNYHNMLYSKGWNRRGRR